MSLGSTKRQESRLLEAVAQSVLELVSGNDPLSHIVHEHLLTRGGQLRARLAFASSEAFGVPEATALRWAVCCELLHNATLIHDDVQDRDERRRGQPTVWARHGDGQAINAGDLLLTLPYLAIDDIPVEPALRWHLTKATARRAEETVRGQALEMTLVSRRPWTWDDYHSASSGKTGALLGLPVQGAALLGGWAPERAALLGDAFRDLGVLYQIQDDVVELFGNKNRGRRGSDVHAGRVTALAVEHATRFPDEQEWLFRLLSRGTLATTAADVDALAARLETTGTLRAVLARASIHAATVSARPCLRAEPEVSALARWLASRCLEPLAGVG